MKSMLTPVMLNINTKERPRYVIGQIMQINHPHSIDYRYFIPDGNTQMMEEITKEEFETHKGDM